MRAYLAIGATLAFVFALAWRAGLVMLALIALTMAVSEIIWGNGWLGRIALGFLFASAFIRLVWMLWRGRPARAAERLWRAPIELAAILRRSR